MIKNIIFDLGSVILKGHPNIILNMLDLDKDNIEDLNRIFFKNLKKLDMGNCSLGQYFQDCDFNFKIEANIEEKLIHYYKYRPFNQEIIKLIKQLKDKNYKVYILSDNNIDTKEYLMKLPFWRNVDGFVFSCDYKILKPDPEIYKILFKKYNLNPEECFFIDDKKQNIEAGKILGMKGFVFKDKDNGLNDLLKELNKNNIRLKD